MNNELLILVFTTIVAALGVGVTSYILWLIGTFIGPVAEAIAAGMILVMLVLWLYRKGRKDNG